MKRAAVATITALGAVSALGAGLLTVSSASASRAATCTPTAAVIAAVATSSASPSLPTPSVTPSGTPGVLPDSIGPYKGVQLVNAAHIVVAAQRLKLGARAQAVGVMTAIGESTLRVLDHGDEAGPDSRGLFQQRAKGWGTYADRMDPQISAGSFFAALIKVPGWESMPPTLAAHATQKNADPYHYEPYWSEAVAIVAALSGDPDLASKLPASAAIACAPSQAGTFTGAGGEFGAEACSVVPDPTTRKGCLTPRTAALAAQLQSQGWSLSCWDAHAWNPTSDHPRGKACDVFPGTGGQMPNAAEKTAGDALAATLQASASSTGVKYLIWYGQIWDSQRDDTGAWRPYGGGGVYDPSDITGGHFDHVHISLR